MRSSQVIIELAKSSCLNELVLKEVKENQIADTIRQYFPKLITSFKASFEHLLRDNELFAKLHKLCEIYTQFEAKAEIVEQQILNKTRHTTDQKSIAVNKKITRAALARRHEKTQQEIKKDQIFIRLTPKSQACIQFMLCNRNFPRMQVKLSCNQHLEYLINYLSNKWLRGKVGYKVVLYPDNSFLKALAINEKEKAVKEPFNNYLMFTDIMTCCGVTQNGVLNMTYEIVEAKKQNNKQLLITPENNKAKVRFENNRESINSTERVMKESFNFPEISNSFVDKVSKVDDRQQSLALKINSPSKYTYKDDMPDYALYNKNSNFYPNNQESMFGCSLGFNYNISKKEDPHYFTNSINYFDSYVHEFRKNDEKQKQENNRKKQTQNHLQGSPLKLENRQILKEEHEFVKENSQQGVNVLEKVCKEEPAFQDKKLGTLMSIIDIVEKEKERSNQQQLIEQPQNNNSNRFKEVKTVNIVKKKANMS